jgi:hypothetical protein
MEVPMLDDEKFDHALSLRGTGTGDLWNRQFGPVFREYERITGFHETNNKTPFTIMSTRPGLVLSHTTDQVFTSVCA